MIYPFAALVKVRNAIQALQEMTYSTMASQTNLNGRFPPARSIPNLPNEGCSTEQANDSFALARSSSQPAEMWVHEIVGDVNEAIISTPQINWNRETSISISTQTENENDLAALERIIFSNRRLVLRILSSENTVDSEVHNLDLDAEVKMTPEIRNSK